MKNQSDIEQWKDIPGFEGLYSVSNMGQVKSLFRYKRIIKGGKDLKGYIKVALCKNKITYTRTLHRLVGLTFIPNPLNLPQVNHKDGNKSNNKVSNLEWCTCQHNNLHAIETGLRTNFKGGDKNGSKVLNTKTGEEYISIAECATLNQMKTATLNRYLNNKRKSKTPHLILIK